MKSEINHTCSWLWPTVLHLVIVLQQDPDHSLHALCLHRFACKLQQVLQSISRVGGLTEVDVQSRRLTGFGQTQLLGWSFFMRNLSAQNRLNLKIISTFSSLFTVWNLSVYVRQNLKLSLFIQHFSVTCKYFTKKVMSIQKAVTVFCWLYESDVLTYSTLTTSKIHDDFLFTIYQYIVPARPIKIWWNNDKGYL